MGLIFKQPGNDTGANDTRIQPESIGPRIDPREKETAGLNPAKPYRSMRRKRRISWNFNEIKRTNISYTPYSGKGVKSRMNMQAQSVAYHKYLTFSLGDEEYGIEILNVREIIGMIGVTPIPETPEFVKGVINLRGKVIPVIDLRLKFQMEERAYDERTCIIVVQIKMSDLIQIGIIVDSVSEVSSILQEDIEPPPAFGLDQETSYIMGMAKSKEDVKILLDIDRVLSNEELKMMDYQ